MYFALRGVDLGAVVAEFRRANLVVLLGLSLPAYLAVVWLRAVRWRHFTDSVAPMPRGALFRAVAVGFMANNLFPLRMGEFVRSWYLGRECGVAPASILGTVILERVVDTLMVILLALAVVLALGGQAAGSWTRGLLLLLPVALLPFAGIAWLKIAPDQVLTIAAAVTRPLSTRTRSLLLSQLERFGEGLGALSGGSHLFWIGLHTASIWLIASTIPMLAGFLSLGVDFGTPLDNLAAAWMTLAAVGIAVALPSAPGFFGLYHSACRLVFERFGIPSELAVALGTLLHAVFWVSLTLLGLAVLRARHTSLGELDAAAGPGSEEVQ
jgi:uncharacterized protein (TIRG00374 family)